MKPYDWNGPRDKDKVLSEAHKKLISKSKMGSKNPRARKVLDTSTGVIYDTATEAARTINVHAAALIGKLLGHRKNNTTFVYLNNDKKPGPINPRKSKKERKVEHYEL